MHEARQAHELDLARLSETARVARVKEAEHAEGGRLLAEIPDAQPQYLAGCGNSILRYPRSKIVSNNHAFTE